MDQKLILIGTDHRLQMTIAQDPTTKAWVPRTGGQHFRKLIIFCIEQLGAGAILEEAHSEQEGIAPTICSTVAKERGLPWQALAMGEPDLTDALFNPPFGEAMRLRIKPELLAGRYVLKTQISREAFMRQTIMKRFEDHDCLLAVVGYVHLGVLANRFDAEQIRVEALLYMYPLVVDESKA